MLKTYGARVVIPKSTEETFRKYYENNRDLNAYHVYCEFYPF